MDSFFAEAKKYVSAAEKWWGVQPKARQAGYMIIGTTIAAAIVGGPIWQYTACALLTNALFWYEFKDSPRVIEFLRKHGAKIDMTISVLSIFMAGATLGGFLTGLMFGSYFTLFRIWKLSELPAVEDSVVSKPGVLGVTAEGHEVLEGAK
jgi:hypothetical protein